MALTPDYENLIIYSDASILDVVAFHATLRDIEASEMGILYPSIHTYKQLPLSGGAIFPAVGFINGWSLQFPAGNYAVSGGNITATINPVVNCFVERTQSAAYAVTSVGGTGLSQDDLNNIAVIVAEQLAAAGGNLTPEQDALLSNAATKEDVASIAFMEQIIKNKRELLKDGATWYLVVYDDDNVTPILRKPLSDVSGAELVDLIPGVLAREGASLV